MSLCQRRAKREDDDDNGFERDVRRGVECVCIASAVNERKKRHKRHKSVQGHVNSE